MNYKGVLFDFDGTLVASMEEHFKGWKYALNYFGKSLEPLDLFVLEGQGVSKVGLQLLQKNDIPLSNLDLVLKMKKEYFQNNNNVQVYPGAIEVLKWLMNNEVEVGLVTGGDRKRVNCFLEKNRWSALYTTFNPSPSVS